MTVHRFAAVPKWLGDQDMEISAGDNQDPIFRKKMADLAAQGPDMPRKMMNDHGYFTILEQ